MSKKFNIHDWQAKQKRLTERKAFDTGMDQELDDTTKSRIAFYPEDKPDDKLPPYGDKQDLEFDIKKYIGQTFASWMSPDYPAFAQEYAKPPYINKLVTGIIDIVNGGGIKEHHNDEDFPGKDLSSWDLLDKIKSSDKELYDRVEDFMKSMKEMSSTGTGASFNAGAGEGYMTPRAFKKKNK